MTTSSKTNKELKKEFDLIWGEAPEGSLKYKKGMAVWYFIEKALAQAKEAGREETILEIKKKLPSRCSVNVV